MVPLPYMVKTTIYLSEEAAARVRRKAALDGKSQAEVVREAIDRHTADLPQRISPNWGKFSSGQSDLSSRVKEVFAEAMEEKYKRWRS
jgi:hypothetical protein